LQTVEEETSKSDTDETKPEEVNEKEEDNESSAKETKKEVKTF